MSLPGFEAFTTALTAGTNLRARKERQGLIAEQTRAAKRENDEQEVIARNSNLRTLGEELGVVMPGGRRIDTDKLNEQLTAAIATGKLDPRLQEFSAAIGNTDLAIKNNPGFQLNGFRVDPETGLFSMDGTYDDGTVAPITTDRSADPNAEVAFAPPEQIAKLLANQFFRLQTDLNDPTAREQDLKIREVNSGFSIEDNLEKMDKILVQQYAAVDEALHATGNEALRTQFSMAYANEGDPVKRYDILKLFADKLEVKNELPSKEEVVAIADAVKEKPPLNPDGSEQRPALSNVPLDDLQARISKVDQTGPGIITDESVMKKVDAASDEEIAEGKVAFGPQDIKAVRDNLENAGIYELADLNKASARDRRMVWAMLSTVAKDSDQRAAYKKQFTNEAETGFQSMDSKQLSERKVAMKTAVTAGRQADTARMQAKTAEGRLKIQASADRRQWSELGQKIRTATYETVKNATKNLRNVLFDDKNQPKEINFQQYKDAVFGSGGSISSVWGKYKNEKPGSDRHRVFRRHMLEQFSAFLQTGSADGGLEWSFFATDSGATVNFSDSALDRISIGSTDSNGNPLEWIVTKPGGSGVQDGDKWTAKQVQEAIGNDELYDFFVGEMANASNESKE